METTQRPCPDCGRSIPEHPGYTTWCECGWNLLPHRPESIPTLADRISLRNGDRIAESLYASMQGRVPEPRWTFSTALAFALAAIVHLSSLLLVVLGIWLPVTFWPNIPAIVAGGILVGMAWVVRPRLRKPPEPIAPREEYPELYRLVDQIAAELGHGRIAGIALTPEFNAFYTTAGLRGDAYIGLGLPLWRVLSPQERVGLLGHEIGHGVNGDVQRGVFVGSAVDALTSWYQLICPRSIFDNEMGGPGLFVIPFNILMAGLAQIPRACAWTLTMLMLRSSQRAEYLADYLQSIVAGTESTLSGLEKLHHGRTVDLAIHRATLRSDSPFFPTLDRLMNDVPRREIERIHRVTLLADSRIDATHPPTALRYRFIEARQVTEARVVLDGARNDCIEGELAGAYDWCERRVVEQYTAGLYA